MWFGSIGDARNAVQIHEMGVEAVVLLSTDLTDPPARDTVVCRVPLVDGEGNASWRLQLAIDAVASLVSGDVPTLVCCSNGMSRSPSVIAAALVKIDGIAADDQLKRLLVGRAADVSPGLWRDIRRTVDQIR